MLTLVRRAPCSNVPGRWVMETRNPRSASAAPAPADIEHHIDREALVVQLRALGTAVERLADAVEVLAPEPVPPAIEQLLEDVRWQLKQIW
jgi:hypothetical protein